MYLTEEEKDRDRNLIGSLFSPNFYDEVFMLIDIKQGNERYPYVMYLLHENTMDAFPSLELFYPYL